MRVSLSALKPSDYRPFVKGWDKTKYAKEFQLFTGDRNKYRIYLPLKFDNERVVTAPKSLQDYLGGLGYTVEDYSAGIASDSKGRRRRIATLLVQRPDLLKLFSHDPKRAVSRKEKDKYLVVISRHPYDIAGMSTDRGWKSCMKITKETFISDSDSDSDSDENSKSLFIDVKYGTLVAYVVSKDDLNIKRPMCRTRIHRYTNEADPSIYMLKVVETVYGTEMPGFIDTVHHWCEDINRRIGIAPGTYSVEKGIYLDGSEHRGMLFIDKTWPKSRIPSSVFKFTDLESIPKLVHSLPPSIRPRASRVLLQAFQAMYRAERYDLILKTLEKDIKYGVSGVSDFFKWEPENIPKELLPAFDAYSKNFAFSEYKHIEQLPDDMLIKYLSDNPDTELDTGVIHGRDSSKFIFVQSPVMRGALIHNIFYGHSLLPKKQALAELLASTSDFNNRQLTEFYSELLDVRLHTLFVNQHSPETIDAAWRHQPKIKNKAMQNIFGLNRYSVDECIENCTGLASEIEHIASLHLTEDQEIRFAVKAVNYRDASDLDEEVEIFFQECLSVKAQQLCLDSIYYKSLLYNDSLNPSLVFPLYSKLSYTQRLLYVTTLTSAQCVELYNKVEDSDKPFIAAYVPPDFAAKLIDEGITYPNLLKVEGLNAKSVATLVVNALNAQDPSWQRRDFRLALRACKGNANIVKLVEDQLGEMT